MKRLTQLDGLRGLSAIAVMLFHFTGQFPAGFWRDVGGHVLFGMFFFISGLILPLACRRDLSSHARVGGFLASRLTRLYPPFLLSVLLVLVLQSLSELAPGFRGQVLDHSWRQILSSLLYVADLNGEPWLSPVYWTLALEMQWYLLLVLAGPWLIDRPWRFLAMVLVLAWMPSPQLIWHWLPLFGAGWSVAHFHRGRSDWRGLLVQLSVYVGIATLTLGGDTAAVILIGVAAIFLLARPLARLQGLGSLSYSLYLLHVPIGGRIINLAMRLDLSDFHVQTAALALAVGLSLLAARLSERHVEQPAIAWAHRVRAWLAPQPAPAPAPVAGEPSVLA